uniref:E3 ubiquitin-protein ligase RING1-like n=1 Tax=Fragaria vesca subsp. vesca TaxID=101020 RepID=UPI0005C91F0C|nr:PREDICTED: E3 ubiquitin-protein ligase RING1-like [Fragaria vesca subsp. vesca]
MEPNNNDCEMEWGDCLDAMLAGLSYELHDLYHDNYHADALAQELIALTEIDIDNDYLIEDVQLMNHRDIEAPNQDVDTDQPFQYLYSSLTEYDTEYGDHLVLESDMLLMDFEFSIDMDTDDNGNEEIDRITLESMETYMAMTIPTSKSAIEELEKVRFESVEAARHAGLCVICMEDFKAGVEATCLPCQHFYHGDCVVQWLEINHQCPLCRFLMPHD